MIIWQKDKKDNNNTKVKEIKENSKEQSEKAIKEDKKLEDLFSYKISVENEESILLQIRDIIDKINVIISQTQVCKTIDKDLVMNKLQELKTSKPEIYYIEILYTVYCDLSSCVIDAIHMSYELDDDLAKCIRLVSVYIITNLWCDLQKLNFNTLINEDSYNALFIEAYNEIEKIDTHEIFSNYIAQFSTIIISDSDITNKKLPFNMIILLDAIQDKLLIKAGVFNSFQLGPQCNSLRKYLNIYVKNDDEFNIIKILLKIHQHYKSTILESNASIMLENIQLILSTRETNIDKKVKALQVLHKCIEDTKKSGTYYISQDMQKIQNLLFNDLIALYGTEAVNNAAGIENIHNLKENDYRIFNKNFNCDEIVTIYEILSKKNK